jgi:hypothetical protein
MLIKEGSKIKIVEGNDFNGYAINEIIANEDINIENNSYTILLRYEGSDKNNLFESDKIVRVNENNYIIYGYFKDALLVTRYKNNKIAMFESYMD